MENHGTDPRTRGKLLDERIRAMREMWTREQAEFHGEFVDFDPIYAWPKPVQQPHPPIYVGGGEAAFARIQEYGDAWLANSLSPEKLEPLLENLRQQTGREVPTTVFGASAKPEALEGYARLGVERALVMLPTLSESETLQKLDELAEATAAYA